MTVKYQDILIELFKRFTGRKFVLAVFAAVIAIFNNKYFHLTPEQIELLQYVVLAFIGVEGAADVVSRFTNIPPQQPIKK